MRFQNTVDKFKYGAMVKLLIALLLLFSTNLAVAKNSDEDRWEFYGIIQERPLSHMHGEWVIGDRVFVTDRGTEFDETEGSLSVGGCAKVHIRDGRLHEIDSEPMHDCH